MSERTLAEMAADAATMAGSGEVLHIAGKPATACPYCGAAMFVNGTQVLNTRVDRYERCRNCKKTFITRQPPKVFVREVGSTNEEISSAGKEALSIYNAAG